MNEQRITQDRTNRIANDFEISYEVENYHQLYGKVLRLDLVLRAKEHLKEQGFISDWFGIEYKRIQRAVKQTSKILACIRFMNVYASTNDSFLITLISCQNLG